MTLQADELVRKASHAGWGQQFPAALVGRSEPIGSREPKLFGQRPFAGWAHLLRYFHTRACILQHRRVPDADPKLLPTPTPLKYLYLWPLFGRSLGF